MASIFSWVPMDRIQPVPHPREYESPLGGRREAKRPLRPSPAPESRWPVFTRSGCPAGLLPAEELDQEGIAARPDLLGLLRRPVEKSTARLGTQLAPRHLLVVEAAGALHGAQVGEDV